jgi:hypothetical protein
MRRARIDRGVFPFPVATKALFDLRGAHSALASSSTSSMVIYTPTEEMIDDTLSVLAEYRPESIACPLR